MQMLSTWFEDPNFPQGPGLLILAVLPGRCSSHPAARGMGRGPALDVAFQRFKATANAQSGEPRRSCSMLC